MVSPRRARKMAEVAAEFGEPFWDVVQGLADMGYGKGATADAMGYDRSAFSRLVRDLGQHIRWPAYADQVVWRERHYPPDWRERISAGRRRSGKGLRILEVDGTRMLQRDYARAQGISETQAWKLRRRGRLRTAQQEGERADG